MFKALCLMKRRPGMSMPEFIDYYENVHTKFIRYAVGIRRYMRRYVIPVMIPPAVMLPPDNMEGQELDFDAVMEMWFDDRAAFDAAAANLYSPEIGPLVRADEEKLFDRSKIRVVTVEEYETDLSVYQ